MRAKIVKKPWGREEWLEQNDRYCYKRLYVDAGERTSLQYHEKKLETNYIVEGQAEIWLENDEGEIVKTVMGPGEFFTVVPPKKHRVVALTDIILQECSTPEVDDVIRIDDDHHRPDGRIETEHVIPALCILAAGQGGRLEHLGKNINKGLLPIEDKAAISHLIDITPLYFDIVIALGHCGELVKEYCEVVHPTRNFIWVDVDKIEGPDTGPGYSLTCCKEHLQRPFYLACNDGLVDELPDLDRNWLGIYPTGMPELYSTVEFDDEDRVTSFVNKSPDGYNHAFIGLAGIHDYDTFWEELEKNQDNGEVVCAFYDPEAYCGLYAKKFEWTDIGTIDGYLRARNNAHSLPKITGECLYHVDNRCIKIFPGGVGGRLKRSEILEGLVPKILHAKSHIMAYEWVSGQTLYEIDEFDEYTAFLHWCQDRLWAPTLDVVDMTETHNKFYREKTIERLGAYQKLGRSEVEKVNGKLYNKIEYYLDAINWNNIGGVATKMWHGDLQFDNGIKSDNGFKLIDWRESFGGGFEYGDMIYDLGKLYGGILINYLLMRDSRNISVVRDDDEITVFHRGTNALNKLQPWFENWVSDITNIENLKVVTGLIFLNMAPLHEQPFSDMLFYKAKETLGGIID